MEELKLFRMLNVLKRFFTIGERSKIYKITYYRLTFFKKGTGSFVINDMTYNINSHALYYLKIGDVFQVIQDGPEPLEFINIQFDIENSPSQQEVLLLLKSIPTGAYIMDTGFPNLLFEQIYKEFHHHLLYSSEQINLMIMNLFHFIRRNIEIPTNGNLSDVKVIKIIEFIHANYNKSLTNVFIGNYFHFHPNYINLLIKKSTSMSLHGYLMNVRINKALELLIETNLSVNEISSIIGFNDAAYFSRVFKSRELLSPSQYRKKWRHGDNIIKL